MNLPKGETRQELLNRTFLYIILITFAVLIIIRVKALLFDLSVAIILSVLAEPAVYRLSKKVNRKLAASLTVLIILLVLTGVFLAIIPVMIDEIYFLSTQVSTYFADFFNYAEENFGLTISSASIDIESQFQELIQSYGNTVGSGVVFAGQAILNTIFHVFIIFFFAFYFISEGDGWRIRLKESLPSTFSNSIDDVWRIGVSKAGGFIISKVILGLLASFFLSVAFYSIGLPSPIALGISAGIISQLIPVVGAFLGGLVPFIASISLGGQTMVLTLSIMFIYQAIENYLLSPRITKSTMEVHPAVAVFSTLFGAYTFGAVGAVLALPVAATIQGVLGIIISNRKETSV